MRGHRSHRRALALVTCLLWLLAVEVLPAVHLVAHHDDHTHAADGSLIEHEHEHEHDVERHDHDASHDDEREPRLAFDHDVPARHDGAGASHHAVALHAAAVPAFNITTFSTSAERGDVLCHLCSIATTPASARGPPASV